MASDDRLLRLAASLRRVRTEEGARHYQKPVGAIISVEDQKAAAARSAGNGARPNAALKARPAMKGSSKTSFDQAKAARLRRAAERMKARQAAQVAAKKVVPPTTSGAAKKKAIPKKKSSLNPSQEYLSQKRSVQAIAEALRSGRFPSPQDPWRIPNASLEKAITSNAKRLGIENITISAKYLEQIRAAMVRVK